MPLTKTKLYMNIKMIMATGALTLMAFTACNNKSGTTASESSSDNAKTAVAGVAKLEFDSVGFKESKRWMDKELGEETGYTVEYSADFPVSGPQPLVDSIRAYIATSLDMPAKPVPTDGKALINEAGKKALKDGAKESYGSVGGENIFSFKMDMATKGFVSFTENTYVFTGGAHGLGVTQGVMFDAADGHRLGWEIFPASSLPKVKALVEQGICRQYFEVADWNAVWDGTPQQKFELPTLPPTFTQKGILFNYAPYELGYYAMGAPYCIIPYSDIESLLTPQAAALLKGKP